jgi:polyphosphate glucokinase
VATRKTNVKGNVKSSTGSAVKTTAKRAAKKAAVKAAAKPAARTAAKPAAKSTVRHGGGYILSIDVGGTGLKAAIIDTHGKMVTRPSNSSIRW